MSFGKTFLLLLVAFFANACYGPKNGVGNQTTSIDNPRVGDPANENVLDLTQYIRRLGNAQVIGEGASATITIRGVATINSDTNPLFVVNGNIVGRDYGQVYDMVDVTQLSSVRILKNAEDIGFYGSRGTNGIVEITLK